MSEQMEHALSHFYTFTIVQTQYLFYFNITNSVEKYYAKYEILQFI